jgi:hypothetical protein
MYMYLSLNIYIYICVRIYVYTYPKGGVWEDYRRFGSFSEAWGAEVEFKITLSLRVRGLELGEWFN